MPIDYVADHHIHYFDLRNAKEPLFVFRGHKKAVSYVKFMSKDEIVSAYVKRHPQQNQTNNHSTGLQIVLWNCGGMAIRSVLEPFLGMNLQLFGTRTNFYWNSFSHINEKNFVGLAVNGDYVCCGSENNGVYAYYKVMSKPVVGYKFGSSNPVTVRSSVIYFLFRLALLLTISS